MKVPKEEIGKGYPDKDGKIWSKQKCRGIIIQITISVRKWRTKDKKNKRKGGNIQNKCKPKEVQITKEG